MTKIYGIYEKNGQCVTVGTVKEIVRYLKSEGVSARAICYAIKKEKQTNIQYNMFITKG